MNTDEFEGHAIGRWWWDDIGILADVDGEPIAEMTEGWNTQEATAKLIAAAPDLLAEVKRLREWIYHHAKNLDAGGVHTFADEAREAIGVKEGEVMMND